MAVFIGDQLFDDGGPEVPRSSELLNELSTEPVVVETPGRRRLSGPPESP